MKDPKINHEWLVAPNIDMPELKTTVEAMNERGEQISLPVIKERAITLFLNGQEIVTNMTIGDHPEYLAVGYLVNQHLLKEGEQITAIDYDEELSVVVVRTDQPTSYEEKLKKKIRTSGCAQGTMFGDVMEQFEHITLDPSSKVVLTKEDLFHLLKVIPTTPSLYLEAGAIHGCVLAKQANPLIYMEDVGRHNAVDKIAGYMRQHNMDGGDKLLFTTGRLTSEMVIKCVMMRIPVLVSRSGFTVFGIELARKANLTLIGRAKGQRYLILNAPQRLV